MFYRLFSRTGFLSVLMLLGVQAHAADYNAANGEYNSRASSLQLQVGDTPYATLTSTGLSVSNSLAVTGTVAVTGSIVATDIIGIILADNKMIALGLWDGNAPGVIATSGTVTGGLTPFNIAITDDVANTGLSITHLSSAYALTPIITGGSSGISTGDNFITSPQDIWFSMGGSLVPQFTIQSNGQVGIGVTQTTAALDVSGSIEYTGTITDVSDKRLKTDIQTLPKNQLDNIAKLEGVSFKMKDDIGAGDELGFIAQDVQGVYPNLIKEDNNGMLSMNYVGLIAPMVEAMKELKAQNDLLREENEAIRKRLEALEEK